MTNILNALRKPWITKTDFVASSAWPKSSQKYIFLDLNCCLPSFLCKNEISSCTSFETAPLLIVPPLMRVLFTVFLVQCAFICLCGDISVLLIFSLPSNCNHLPYQTWHQLYCIRSLKTVPLDEIRMPHVWFSPRQIDVFDRVSCLGCHFCNALENCDGDKKSGCSLCHSTQY